MAADDEANAVDTSFADSIANYMVDQNVCQDTAFTVECDVAFAAIVSMCGNDTELAAMMEYLDALDEDVANAVTDALASEMVCFNCFGLGHKAGECPSAAQNRIAGIEKLVGLLHQFKDRGRATVRRKPSRSRRARTLIVNRKAYSRDSIELYLWTVCARWVSRRVHDGPLGWRRSRRWRGACR